MKGEIHFIFYKYFFFFNFLLGFFGNESSVKFDKETFFFVKQNVFYYKNFSRFVIHTTQVFITDTRSNHTRKSLIFFLFEKKLNIIK